VFPSARAKCGHVVSIAKAFTEARDAAGLPKDMVIYTARHGALTDVSKVCTLKETMSIGGHSDTRTALGYQQVNTKDIQARLVAARTTGRVQ